MYESDDHWMQLALQQAQLAQTRDEVPVGAVIVMDGKLVSVAHNQPIQSRDPTAHAEILAIRAACQQVQNYRLPGATLYVTLEPCSMCVGAMIHARIERLVFGATDPKTGAICGAFPLLTASCHLHKLDYDGGVLAAACGQILKDFFQTKRLIR